jgi:hypothetical protein
MGNPLVRFWEGPGHNRRYGCNIVAPPGNQAANRENKPQPAARKAPVYSTNVIFTLLRLKVLASSYNP